MIGKLTTNNGTCFLVHYNYSNFNLYNTDYIRSINFKITCNRRQKLKAKKTNHCDSGGFYFWSRRSKIYKVIDRITFGEAWLWLGL